MREIKFRAWDKTHQRMISWEGMQLWLMSSLENDNIMQFTGRFDKNGKEACHRDICIGNWPYAKKCTIEWDEKRCGFYLQPVKGDGLLEKAAYDKGYKLNARSFEVIGNVHQNPELLEK